jgi:hypothetical protein
MTKGRNVDIKRPCEVVPLRPRNILTTVLQNNKVYIFDIMHSFIYTRVETKTLAIGHRSASCVYYNILGLELVELKITWVRNHGASNRKD